MIAFRLWCGLYITYVAGVTYLEWIERTGVNSGRINEQCLDCNSEGILLPSPFPFGELNNRSIIYVSKVYSHRNNNITQKVASSHWPKKYFFTGRHKWHHFIWISVHRIYPLSFPIWALPYCSILGRSWCTANRKYYMGDVLSWWSINIWWNYQKD